jgi:hypothetical protein
MTKKLTEVETRLDASGSYRPAAFNYAGKRIQVISYGRHWEADGAHHFLVMDRQNRVYELAYVQGENEWELIRSPESFGPQRPQAA